MLGTYSPDHQKHFIKFNWQGQKYKLYIFQLPETQVVSSWHMEKMIRKGASTYVIQYHQMKVQDVEQAEFQEEEIQELL